MLMRNIRLLSWFNFCTDLVFFAPVAIIYFAQVTGTYTLGMSIFALAYVAAAVFEVPTGVVSDLVGRKLTMILGAACSVCCVIMYALGGSYWVLALGAVFQGLSRAFYSGNNDALLHDSLRKSGLEKEYHTYLGRVSSMFQVALATATVSGSILASWSFSLVMWISVVPQVCALLIATRVVEPKFISDHKSSNIFGHLKNSLGQFAGNYKLRLLTVTSVLRFSLGEAGFFLRSAFVNSLWPLWAIGLSYGLSHLAAAASYFFSGKIIDRHRPLQVLNFEIIFNRLISLAALLFPSAASPALLAATSLTFGVGSVATNSLLQKEFTHTQRATMSSLASFFGSLTFGLCAVLLGWVADIYDVRLALIISQMILFTPLLVYRLIFVYDLQSRKTA